jgi:hypothetical protein
MTEDWQRIGDDDFAGFGRRQITARRSDNGDTYLVVADDGEQDQVRLTYKGVELLLDIDRKFISPEGVYRLSGGLSDREDGFGIESYAWVELLLTSPAVFRTGVMPSWFGKISKRKSTHPPKYETKGMHASANVTRPA